MNYMVKVTNLNGRMYTISQLPANKAYAMAMKIAEEAESDIVAYGLPDDLRTIKALKYGLKFNKEDE